MGRGQARPRDLSGRGAGLSDAIRRRPLGYFKEAGLDCKLIQGGSGVKTREIIASSQGDIGIGDITHPMQLTNHGRNGRVLMPVDTRSSSVMFIIRKDL